MLSNEQVRRAYDDLAPEFELARELIAARARAGLTQAEVARRMRTTQSAVARLESGRRVPSIDSLRRYAAATGSHAVVRLIAADRHARAGESGG
jgi:transcriptional regulator with XRE-family HTH domain